MLKLQAILQDGSVALEFMTDDSSEVEEMRVQMLASILRQASTPGCEIDRLTRHHTREFDSRGPPSLILPPWLHREWKTLKKIVKKCFAIFYSQKKERFKRLSPFLIVLNRPVAVRLVLGIGENPNDEYRHFSQLDSDARSNPRRRGQHSTHLDRRFSNRVGDQAAGELNGL
jgi:hypothetical protein